MHMGLAFMQGFYTEFDQHNLRIGLAPIAQAHWQLWGISKRRRCVRVWEVIFSQQQIPQQTWLVGMGWLYAYLSYISLVSQMHYVERQLILKLCNFTFLALIRAAGCDKYTLHANQSFQCRKTRRKLQEVFNNVLHFLCPKNLN